MVLGVQHATDRFDTWAYAWTLVVLAGAGIGRWLVGMVSSRSDLAASGAWLGAAGSPSWCWRCSSRWWSGSAAEPTPAHPQVTVRTFSTAPAVEPSGLVAAQAGGGSTCSNGPSTR
jgi:hypothetical protein